MIAELGTGRRHITHDERARGGSKRSVDHSFEACVRDLDAVLETRGVDRPLLLVGLSYGATLAAHWAARNPDRVLGMVAVVGAMPYGLTGDQVPAYIVSALHGGRLLPGPLLAEMRKPHDPAKQYPRLLDELIKTVFCDKRTP